jgi:hypothetical protein
LEFVSIIDVFGRRRFLLVVGLVASVALGAVATGLLPPRSNARATPSSGAALAQVEIDRGLPLIATTARGGTDTIVQQSVLLATFMGSDAMTGQIAKRAGLRADELAVVVPTLPPASEFELFPDGQLPVVAAAASQAAGHRPYVVKIAPSYTVPIIQVGTIAPSRGGSVSLAQATIATLRAATVLTRARRATNAAPRADLAASRTLATGLSVAKTSDALRRQQALVVRSLGPVSSAAVQANTPGIRAAAAASAALFAIWCLGLLFAAGLRRLWASGDHQVTTAIG